MDHIAENLTVPPDEMIPILARALKTSQTHVQVLEEKLALQRRSDSAEISTAAYDRAIAVEGQLNTTIVELQEDLQEALKANEKLEERLQDLADIKPIIVKNEPRDYLGEELQAMCERLEESDRKNGEIYAKYKTEKESKREFRRLRDELEEKASKLEENIAGLMEEKTTLQAACQELEIKMKNRKEEYLTASKAQKMSEPTLKGLIVPAPKQPPTSQIVVDQNAKAHQLTAQFSQILARPNLSEIKESPVSRNKQDLNALLDSLLGSDSADSIFLFPCGIIWSTVVNGKQPTTSQHGVLFRPAQQFHVAKRSWHPSSYASCFDGHTQKMFLNHRGSIAYCGTYRCHQLPGVTVLPNHITYRESAKALAKVTIIGEQHPATTRYLESLYKEGALHVECIVLQCIGYDAAFNKALLAHPMSIPSSNNKRAGSNDENDTDTRPLVKRRKMNDGSP